MLANPISLLRLDAVKSRTGLGRSKIYDLIAASPRRFPAPIHIAGTRVSAWPSDAIDRWIAAQVANATVED